MFKAAGFSRAIISAGKIVWRKALLCVLPIFILALISAGCSGSSNGSTDEGPIDQTASPTVSDTVEASPSTEPDSIVPLETPPVTESPEAVVTLSQLVLNPAEVTLNIGETQVFEATVLDAEEHSIPEAEISWEIVEGMGEITADGVLTAGTRAGTYDEGIAAIATLNGTSIQTSASVTINPGSAVGIDLSPIEVPAGETLQLDRAAIDEYGNPVSNPECVWNMRDENAGTVTADGVLTAGKVAGHFREALGVSLNKGGETEKLAIDVIVVPGSLAQVIIAPDQADIGIEMTQQFVAVGADDYGNRIEGLTFEWTVENGGGSIDENGLFTAGKDPDTYQDTVKVVASQGEITQEASATVTVEPDRMAFVSNREDDQFDIYVMDADGTNVQRLTHTAGPELGISWSPDGRRIVYDSVGPDGTGIFIMSTDNGWTRQVVQNSKQDSFDAYPSWSPDGTKIAFVRFTDVTEDIDTWRSDIFVVGVDGSGLTQLTDTPDDTEWAPAWSPDGTRIAYDYTKKGRKGDIYVMDADGSNNQRLTTNLANDTSPVWSPDGSRIAFVSDRSGDNDVFVMNADGSNEKLVTSDHPAENVQDNSPSWSPTGALIAFVSNRDYYDDNGSMEVYTIPRGGGKVTRITEDTADDVCVAWAPRKRGIDISELSVVIPNASTLPISMTTQEVANKVKGSVVKIETDQGFGSGFIIDSNGLIMTNSHVVAGAESITVYLNDGTSYEGTVKNQDVLRDLAVIQIDATDLPPLEFGDVSHLALGQQVMVMGYPLDAETVNVTSGLVSSVELDRSNGVTYVKTDSAVNAGNSGGPLLNLQGQVVGIVSSKLVGVAVEGVGYAISANTVKAYLPELLAENEGE